MPKRFTKDDKEVIVEKICDSHSDRKRKRRYLEKQWAEIDRQLEMTPSKKVQKARQGKIEQDNAWMAETELPNQAETLEISVADARRLMFPKDDYGFSAHAGLTDEYLSRVDYQAMIAGDKNDVPSRITQDNADKLVQGTISNWRNQYGFKGNIDQINGEAFKYSMGVGRGRYVKKRVFLHTSKGVQYKDQKIPIIVPRSIKRTYLDDSCHSLNNEGISVAPGQIFEYSIQAKDLQMASASGSSDVDDMQGGWIKGAMKEWNAAGSVNVLEWEGDMVVERKSTGALYLANSIISVAVGYKSGKKTSQTDRVVFRIRKNEMPFSSYILFPYHQEHIDSPYATSPLMKGRPVQATATEALNMLMELGALNVLPPLSRDSDTDEEPEVYPGAIWGDTVKPNQIGDPQAMLAVYSSLLQQYADVTGTTAPRLGAQTVSHTTAYAKDAELARGQVRINNYVDSTNEGPMKRWLHMEYEMGRANMTDELFYIKPYNGFVQIKKSFLPDFVEFDVYGAGQPADEQAKFQKRMVALQQAVQLDQLRISMGMPPKLNLDTLIEQELLQGGWTDIDMLINQSAPQTQMEPNPGLQVAAQQGLAFGS